MGRLVRLGGIALAAACSLLVPILAGGAAPASADTVINGCTIVTNPTSTIFTNCPGANLGTANLSGVNLSFANLAGASFVDCSAISGTNCAATNLSGATLTDADLAGASFFNVVPYSPCGVPSCLTTASGATILAGADLSRANLSSAKLHRVDLTNAVLIGANLTGATFTGCLATLCGGGATLTGANLTGATLTNSDLSGTFLVPSNQSVLGTSSGAVVTWPIPQSLPGATPGGCSTSSGSSFPIGSTVVTCQVLDDNGHTGAGQFTVAVSRLSTSVSLTSSVPGSVGSGGQVTFTADVSTNPSLVPNAPLFPSGGTVGFTDNGVTISSCTAAPLVAGNPSEASCSVTFGTAGIHQVQPVYSGSGIFLGSYGQTLAQDVASAVPPTTSVVLPANGTAVTGTTWLDAAATSSAGVASVSYVLTGPGDGRLPGTSNTVISKATATPYGWLGVWDSTGVANGTYTLQSVATDVHGISNTSAPITVTVNNPLASTSVIIPSTGTTQSGTAALLDASTSGNAYYSTSVFKLVFEVSGGPSHLNDQIIATGTPTIYGWLSQWNTQTVPNGTYTLQSVGTYTGFGTVTSAPITITVNNAPPSTGVVIPSNNATVSGASQVLDASTSPGVTQVQYQITGGTRTNSVIATATPTIYGWIAVWNTTGVANGTYTLQSVASYPGGVTGISTPVSITVHN